MKRKLKIFWYSLLVVLVLIQFYPTDKPMVSAENPKDLIINNKVPENVAIILRAACYDCHSNETIYPWYANIAPLKWNIYNHIVEGRENLNFSEWEAISKVDMVEILDDISIVVVDEEMPLKPYILLHSEANLSLEDRETISEWAELLLEELFE